MYLAGVFKQPLNVVARQEGLPLEDLSELYEDVQLVLLTGWTMEYIRGLGYLDREAILQINESQQAIKATNTQIG